MHYFELAIRKWPYILTALIALIIGLSIGPTQEQVDKANNEVAKVNKQLSRGDCQMQNKNQHKLLSLGDWKKEQFPQEWVPIFIGVGQSSTNTTGFIPGSLYLNINTIEGGPLWNIVSKEQLKTIINRLRIDADTTIIPYGKNMMTAARVAFALMYAGIKDVRLLNGGIDAWRKQGYPLVDNPVQRKGTNCRFKSSKSKAYYLATLVDVKRAIHDPHAVLVDVRSWEEHIGKTTGYNYMDNKGCIPGSVWGYAGSDPYHMEDFEDENGMLRDLTEIEARWEQAGITRNKNVIFYCGTGWRAAEAFFIAHLLGWEHISVYDGGWLEWGQIDHGC